MGPRLYLRGRTYWTAFYGPDGERHRVSTRCRDKRAAERRARELERAAADPKSLSESTTLTDACERFLDDREHRGRSADTIKYYTGKLGVLTRVLGEDTMLVEIDARAVDKLIAKRLGEGVTRHTVSKELGALRSVLRHARRRGEFDADPAAILPENWETGYVPRKRFHTRPQLDALLRELTPKRRAIVAFIVASGAEWRAVQNAGRDDFNWRKREIKVHGTKNRRRARVVPILPVLEEYAKLAHKLASTQGPAFERWINVRRDLAAACVRAGVPTISPHDLRRTPSTWLREMGAPPHMIGSFLGHADGRMVERIYGRIEGAQLGKAIEDTISPAKGQNKARRKRKRARR